jgi:hypothetical protein
LGLLAAPLALAAISLGAQTTPQTTKPMKIGFIGSGNIGGAIGELMARAGHEVFSPRAIPTASSRWCPCRRARTRGHAEGSHCLR